MYVMTQQNLDLEKELSFGKKSKSERRKIVCDLGNIYLKFLESGFEVQILVMNHSFHISFLDLFYITWISCSRY